MPGKAYAPREDATGERKAGLGEDTVSPSMGDTEQQQQKKPTGDWKLNPADAFSLIKLIDSLVSGTPCLVSVHYHMERHQEK